MHDRPGSCLDLWWVWDQERCLWGGLLSVESWGQSVAVWDPVLVFLVRVRLVCDIFEAFYLDDWSIASSEVPHEFVILDRHFVGLDALLYPRAIRHSSWKCCKWQVRVCRHLCLLRIVIQVHDGVQGPLLICHTVDLNGTCSVLAPDIIYEDILIKHDGSTLNRRAIRCCVATHR